MADLDVSGFGPDDGFGAPAYGAASGVGRVMNLIGAALSVALVGGLGYWGYDLIVRDVAGIPVIQAMEGPMRVQPDSPGGERAAHQGLAVNRIAALGEAAPPPDEIVLAPRSADLAAEDLAQAALRATPAVARLPEGTASAPRAQRAVGTPTDPVEAAILAAATGVMTAEAELSGEGLIEAIPASLPGPSRSLRPRLRPPGFAGAPVAAAAAPASVSAGESAGPAPRFAGRERRHRPDRHRPDRRRADRRGRPRARPPRAGRRRAGRGRPRHAWPGNAARPVRHLCRPRRRAGRLGPAWHPLRAADGGQGPGDRACRGPG